MMKKVSLLLLIIILHHSGGYSQNALVLRDTIEHYVVERTIINDRAHADVFKLGTHSKGTHPAHIIKTNSHTSALWQLMGESYGSATQIHEKIRKTLCVHPELLVDTNKPRWLSFNVILSASLNVEYLRIISGSTLGDLSAQDCYALYKALNDPSLYHVWDEPVPYVSFSIRVPLVPDSQ